MIERLFVIYLFSGLIKAYTFTFRIDDTIDITLLSGILLVIAIIHSVYSDLDRLSLGSVFKKASLLLFLAFWGWTFITLAYTKSPDYSAYKTLLFGTNFLAFFTPLFMSPSKFYRIGNTVLILTFVLGSIFFILYPISLYASPQDFFMLDLEEFSKQYQAMGVLSSLSLLFLITKKFSIKRLALIVISIWLLIYSGARGPIIFFVMALCVLLFIKRKTITHRLKIFFNSRKQQFRLSYGLILVVFMNLGYVWLINQNIYTRQVHYRSFARMGLVFDSLIENEGRENSFKLFNKPMINEDEFHEEFNRMEKEDRNKSVLARIYHFQFCSMKLKESPLNALIGFGVGSYGIMFYGEDQRAYPHNIILEAWFELGLIGVIILLLWFVSLLKSLNWSFAIQISMLLFLFLNVMKSSSFIDIRPFFGFAGLLIYRKGLIFNK